jgi:hypothetical protein
MCDISSISTRQITGITLQMIISLTSTYAWYAIKKKRREVLLTWTKWYCSNRFSNTCNESTDGLRKLTLYFVNNQEGVTLNKKWFILKRKWTRSRDILRECWRRPTNASEAKKQAKFQVPGLLWSRLVIDLIMGPIVCVWLWAMAPLSPMR